MLRACVLPSRPPSNLPAPLPPQFLNFPDSLVACLGDDPQLPGFLAPKRPSSRTLELTPPQLPTFPLDTLKKRLQSTDASTTALKEAKLLLSEGGVLRFYRGFPVKCLFVALNGAVFNSVYVFVRKLLRIASDEREAAALGPVDAMTRQRSSLSQTAQRGAPADGR